jgi:pimeloyl-ACP methyl ester carboxylesterase
LIPVVSDLDNTGPTSIDDSVIASVAQINNTLSLLLTPEGSTWTPPQPSETAITAALGPSPAPEAKAHFLTTLAASSTYTSIADKERLRQALISSMTRDSLLSRLADIKAPVLWISGENDPYAIKDGVVKQVGKIKSEVQFESLPGAYHLPTWTHAQQVHTLVIAFVRKHGGIKDARALREAVGMVDI